MVSPSVACSSTGEQGGGHYVCLWWLCFRRTLSIACDRVRCGVPPTGLMPFLELGLVQGLIELGFLEFGLIPGLIEFGLNALVDLGFRRLADDHHFDFVLHHLLSQSLCFLSVCEDFGQVAFGFLYGVESTCHQLGSLEGIGLIV